MPPLPNWAAKPVRPHDGGVVRPQWLQGAPPGHILDKRPFHLPRKCIGYSCKSDIEVDCLNKWDEMNVCCVRSELETSAPASWTPRGSPPHNFRRSGELELVLLGIYAVPADDGPHGLGPFLRSRPLITACLRDAVMGLSQRFHVQGVCVADRVPVPLGDSRRHRARSAVRVLMTPMAAPSAVAKIAVYCMSSSVESPIAVAGVVFGFDAGWRGRRPSALRRGFLGL